MLNKADREVAVLSIIVTFFLIGCGYGIAIISAMLTSSIGVGIVMALVLFPLTICMPMTAYGMVHDLDEILSSEEIA